LSLLLQPASSQHGESVDSLLHNENLNISHSLPRSSPPHPSPPRSLPLLFREIREFRGLILTQLHSHEEKHVQTAIKNSTNPTNVLQRLNCEAHARNYQQKKEHQNETIFQLKPCLQDWDDSHHSLYRRLLVWMNLLESVLLLTQLIFASHHSPLSTSLKLTNEESKRMIIDRIESQCTQLLDLCLLFGSGFLFDTIQQLMQSQMQEVISRTRKRQGELIKSLPSLPQDSKEQKFEDPLQPHSAEFILNHSI